MGQQNLNLAEQINQTEKPSQRIPHLAKLAIVCVIYFITAKFGLELDAVSNFATLIWPPTGIALSVLLLYGFRLWPGIFLGAFLVNVATGAPILVACGIGLGNTLEAVVGAYFLMRIADFHISINRLRDVVSLIVFACVLSPLISATIGVGSLWLGNVKALEGVGVTWRAWWVGDALGSFIVAPLILVWLSTKFENFSLYRVLEAALLVITLIVGNLMIFTEGSLHAFWLFPFVVWGALRFGQMGNITVTFIISAMAIWRTVHGLGPFSHGPLRNSLFLLDSFMVVIGTTGMTLAAALSERKLAVEGLKKEAQAREEFLSIASHELKTPLTSLGLQIQMTKKMKSEGSPSPEKLSKFLDISEKQVHRLINLVEDLMDTTRIQTGKFTFNFEKINLSEVIKEMVDRFSDELNKVQCPLEVAIQENIIGDFDHSRIEQLIDNLLSNAIKYAPGKLVNISLLNHGETVRLVIEDQGPGIPLDKQAKIFQRFGRVSETTNVSGLGLGLFIVREIARGHNGSVDFESVADTGSKFIVKLPLNQA